MSVGISIFITIHVLEFDKEETAETKEKKDEGGVFAQNKNKKVKNKDMRSQSD